jgi:PAS domain S-box-containing protein
LYSFYLGISMSKSVLLFDENTPLYNIQIIRNHIDFVRQKFPEINIESLLNYAGITKLQFNDLGYWCSQRQINKFNEILTKQTGNNDISRETGRYLMDSQNFISQYILGFKGPTSGTLQVASIYSKLSLGATTWGKKLAPNKMEIFAKPKPGVNEQLFQCRNRIGCLEGIYKFFTDEYPHIYHPLCIHDGAEYCRYVISWGKTGKIFRWLRIRNYSFLIGIFISIFIYFAWPFVYFLLTILFASAGMFILTHKINILEKERLNKNIEELGKTSEELWTELNVRYNVTKLVQEVGEITSVIQTENEISSAVSNVMNKRLDYDRGAILLAKNDKSSLFFAGGYGFTENEIELMNNVQFRLDNPVTEGILQKVFNRQEPQIIDDMHKIAHMLDSKNLAIVKKLQVQAMVCVPIIHEGESLGVMAVDSLNPHREFREGDINLLMAIASQTGLSIAHAKAFQKLQESEKKHRTLVETISDIVYTVDLEGRFTYISPMIEVITGYKDKELLGQNFIEIVSPSYSETVTQRFENGIKTGKTSTYEIEIIVKDGRSVPIELNVAPLSDNMGNTIGRIGVARDITERIQAQKKHKEMKIKALTQDKLASLGEIATGIAHEINQPLSYIKIILESTLSELAMEEVNSQVLSEDFNESLRQIGKISNIISHLRTFGRSDVTFFGPVRLSRVLDDTLILMHERLRIKNISFDMRLADELPMLHGNHAKLEQVFINLVQNSMDAMEEQGKGEIVLRARVDNDVVRITYSDTGKGISPKFQEKIFDPFFSTKEPGKGTGIGLSIVYGIIQEHNGAITCESYEGRGASFTIKLPVYVEECAFASAPLDA